jgi:hypothetical protein
VDFLDPDSGGPDKDPPAPDNRFPGGRVGEMLDKAILGEYRFHKYRYRRKMRLIESNAKCL